MTHIGGEPGLESAADEFAKHQRTCPVCQTPTGLCEQGRVLMDEWYRLFQRELNSQK